MALPSTVIRPEGIMFPGKQPVRTAGLVITPLVIVGAVQVEAALAGLRSAPSSAVPTIPSGPRSRNEKSPARSALVGSVPVGPEVRRVSFHSKPPEKKNLSFFIGSPKISPKSLLRIVRV